MDDDEPPRDRRVWRTEQEWSHLRERIAANESRPFSGSRSTRPWARIAAAAAIVVAIGAPLIARQSHEEPAARIVSTTAGERLVVRLSDSSTVTLGPATTLRFTATAARRHVQLDGMADFNVVHDGARPFVVEALNAETVDVGTEFVVRAYQSDSAVRVSVSAGAIALSSRLDPQRTVVLRAGEVGIVGGSGPPKSVPTASATLDASWVDGGLAFDNTPLPRVAAELARWFDVDIRLDGQSLTQRRMSAVYNNPTLSGVLDAMRATLGVQYERSGRNITLRENRR